MGGLTGDLSTERWHCMEVTWKLRDFLRIPAKVDSLLLSSSFSLAETDWQLILYPNGQSERGNEGYLNIDLQRVNFSVDRQRVKARLSFRTRDGETYVSGSYTAFYDDDHAFWGFGRFIERSKLVQEKDSLLPDGTLTVRCQIMVEAPSDDSEASEEKSSETDSFCEVSLSTSLSGQKLQTDYKKLLESKEDADVCLKVSDKEFQAHKCILRARSSVFSDTLEKNSGKVVIEDLDPESFPDFLQHLYSGSIDELSEKNVFNLFKAADKYDCPDLKAECKSYMESTLSVDTFCDVMIVASRYPEDDLLKLAIDFFAKNLKKIIVTVKWQKFLKENDTQANKLLIKALITDDEE